MFAICLKLNQENGNTVCFLSNLVEGLQTVGKFGNHRLTWHYKVVSFLDLVLKMRNKNDYDERQE